MAGFKENQMLNRGWKITVAALLTLTLTTLAPPVQVSAAAPFIVNDDFTVSSALTGSLVGQGAASRQGWSTELTRDGKTYSYIEYDLTPYQDRGIGYMELDLVRKEGPVAADLSETLVGFYNSDGKDLFLLSVEWENGDGTGQSILEFAGNFGKDRAGLWNPVITLGRTVQPGEYIKLGFYWDGLRTRFFLDGKEVNLAPVIYVSGEEAYADWKESSVGFGDLMSGVTHLRLGQYTSARRDTGDFPLTNAYILSFKFLGSAPVFSRISEISHNAFSVAGYSGKLVAGDRITVNLEADPGGTAVFDLGPIKEVPMTENLENPGSYIGSYTVKYGDDVEEAAVTGRFTNIFGLSAKPLAVTRSLTIDTKVYLQVTASGDLIPADEFSRAGLTVVATDANGTAVKGRELKLTLSTTDEYTGTVGGGSFADLVGGALDVDWGGVTDSFGEVTAQYVSGFAAKTVLVSTKDMVSGDVGVGFVRAYIDGTVDIVVTEPRATALSVSGSMNVSLSQEWLTADGQSRSRITAVVEDSFGKPVSGHSVRFTLLGENGAIRVVQGKTDSRGRAIADYIAGTLMGQVQVEVRDLTSGMVAIVPIELRPDAPAEITLTADPGEVVTGGESTVSAKVTDANGNPNRNVDVLYNISVGNGELSSPSVATDEEGDASVTFVASDTPGLVTVSGTIISREPTPEEISAAEGAVFLFGLDEDPGRLDVVEWLVEAGDEVVQGQGLVVLEDRADTLYTVAAPRDGVVSVFTAEERDRVQYGDTLGYVLPLAE